jgi:hypothetical protein
MSLEYLVERYTKSGTSYMNLWSYDGELIEKVAFFDHESGKFKKSMVVIKAPVVHEGKIYKTQRYFEDGIVFDSLDDWPASKAILDEHGITDASKSSSVKKASKPEKVSTPEKFFTGKPRFIESDKPIMSMPTDTMPIRKEILDGKTIWITEDGLQFEDDNGEVGEPIILE